MGASSRKIVLTAHIVCSVGWLGAVAGFLALALAGISTVNAQSMRGVYLAMDLIAWYVILPLALASLVTGVVCSLSTPWGLLRHYWILIKLLVTVFSTVVLMIHMSPIEALAAAAADSSPLDAGLHGAQTMMVVASGAALAALLVLTGLSVYKPRGTIVYRA